jgi:hypothetical protein
METKGYTLQRDHFSKMKQIASLIHNHEQDGLPIIGIAIEQYLERLEHRRI